jgi:hypothetical protein
MKGVARAGFHDGVSEQQVGVVAAELGGDFRELDFQTAVHDRPEWRDCAEAGCRPSRSAAPFCLHRPACG